MSQFYHDKSATKTGQKLNSQTKQTCEISEVLRKLDIRNGYEKSLKVSCLRGLCKKNGGPSEIRTLGGITLAGFQDRCYRPTQPKIHVCKEVIIKIGGATQI